MRSKLCDCEQLFVEGETKNVLDSRGDKGLDGAINILFWFTANALR